MTAPLTPGRRWELAADWRRRADQLDEYAGRCRSVGDTAEAADAEQAAVDYRIAADELDAAPSW